MSQITDRAAVRDALQAGYGDATQTVLDDQVAGQVMGALRERGWASLDEAALLIAAAGGEIRVPSALRLRGTARMQVERFEDHATGETVFRVVDL